MKRVLLLLLLLSALARADIILPTPEVKASGYAGLTLTDSVPFTRNKDAPALVRPNIVLVLLDDVGFGSSDVFGGAIHTPALARLADQGIRYTSFHTAGVCAATRVSLLTGRNHHTVGFASVAEAAVAGFPSRSAIWPKSAASIAEVLKLSGYSTAAFGKWHNTPPSEVNVMGPFDRWPTGLGFEYFYGFIGGDTNQFEPTLIENTRPVVRVVDQEGYHFTTDMADRAIGWIRSQRSYASQKPFFLYFAPGATHAPHQAPPEWINKYRGAFDQGWDKYREETLAKQKELGIVPSNTELTPRPAEIPPWNSLTGDQKKVYARMMEVYAGFLEHTDHEVGRLIQSLDELGLAKNTLIIYIVGDNGASGEGGLYGSLNEVEALLYGVQDESHEVAKSLEKLGGPQTYQIYPAGWGWAGNAPFRWVKRVVSYLGATRNPMVVSWGGGIRDKGTIRSQFHHVVDIVPTILEAVGMDAPIQVNGISQQPINGVSMMYTFGKPGAGLKEPIRAQYFEVEGNKAIYHAGWFASSMVAVPWHLPWHKDKMMAVNPNWELYHLDEDFSQNFDLAKKMPKKLEEMKNLWWTEAGKNQVLPIITTAEMAGTMTMGGHTQRSYDYYPSSSDSFSYQAPPVTGRSHSISAEISPVEGGGAEGVIATSGGRFGGYSFFIKNKRVFYVNNWLGKKVSEIATVDEIPANDFSVKVELRCRKKNCSQFSGKILINGKLSGQGYINNSNVGSWESFDLGLDRGSSIDEACYRPPFSFTGVIKRVKFDLI